MKAGTSTVKRLLSSCPTKGWTAMSASKVIDSGEDNFDFAKRLESRQARCLLKHTDLLQKVVAKNKAVDATLMLKGGG